MATDADTHAHTEYLVARGGELVSYSEEFRPGDNAWLPVAVGANIQIQGPGEHLQVVAPQAAWVRIQYPASAARRATGDNILPRARVQVSQVVEGAFATLDRPVPAPAPVGATRPSCAAEQRPPPPEVRAWPPAQGSRRRPPCPCVFQIPWSRI